MQKFVSLNVGVGRKHAHVLDRVDGHGYFEALCGKSFPGSRVMQSSISAHPTCRNCERAQERAARRAQTRARALPGGGIV